MVPIIEKKKKFRIRIHNTVKNTTYSLRLLGNQNNSIDLFIMEWWRYGNLFNRFPAKLLPPFKGAYSTGTNEMKYPYTVFAYSYPSADMDQATVKSLRHNSDMGDWTSSSILPVPYMLWKRILYEILQCIRYRCPRDRKERNASCSFFFRWKLKGDTTLASEIRDLRRIVLLLR